MPKVDVKTALGGVLADARQCMEQCGGPATVDQQPTTPSRRKIAVVSGNVETPVTKKMHDSDMVPPKTAVVSALGDALVAAKMARDQPKWVHQMSGSDAQAVRSPAIRTTDVRCGK